MDLHSTFQVPRGFALFCCCLYVVVVEWVKLQIEEKSLSTGDAYTDLEGWAIAIIVISFISLVIDSFGIMGVWKEDLAYLIMVSLPC